jgi:F5/8 type C domain
VLTDRRFQAVGIGFGINPESDEGAYWVIAFGSLRDAVISPCEGVTVQVAIESGGRTNNSTNSALAYDGDFSTYWATTAKKPPQNAYIWFDLGSIQAIRSIEWMFAQGGGADRFAIDISLDRETWTQITMKSNASVNEWRTVTWKGSARYVRFYFANPNDDAVLGYLAEVRVFRQN